MNNRRKKQLQIVSSKLEFAENEEKNYVVSVGQIVNCLIHDPLEYFEPFLQPHVVFSIFKEEKIINLWYKSKKNC